LSGLILNAELFDLEAAVEGLLDQGAHPSARRRHGTDTLRVAIENGLDKVVKLLLNKGADHSSLGGSSVTLCMASANSDEATVKLLLDLGAAVST